MSNKKKVAKERTKSPVDAAGFVEVPSTANIRWWVPGEDKDTAITVSIEERQDKMTRFGDRAFYLCTVLKNSEDEKGDLERGLPVMIWESAGLTDLNRFVGQEVMIVPDGRVKRTRVYRFFVRGGTKQDRRGRGRQPDNLEIDPDDE